MKIRSTALNRFCLAPFLLCFTAGLSAQQNSRLWGTDGELWDPDNSILRDFTQVGYKGGGMNEIPDWPVGVKVTDFGAIPGDGIDDSQAFLDAIAACPDYHAVLVPEGRYTILQKLEPQRDHFVLRGEDMYGSVLFFPKYLSEIYIDELVYRDGARNPVYEGFFHWADGTEKSIENLTFEFREERKNGDWDYPGGKALDVSGLSDSWFRNLYFRNVDSAMSLSGTRLSVLNIYIDQFNGRQNVDHNLDAYGGILPRNLTYSLFHNIHITGRLLQPIDLNEVNKHNVYSQYRGGEFNDRSASYHGGGSQYDLYTDLDKGVVQAQVNPRRTDETYWNVDDTSDLYAQVTERVYTEEPPLVIVGMGDTWPLKTKGPLWYEPANYGEISPANLYLAQLDYFGYPRPVDTSRPIPAPYETDGNVYGVLPTDDASPGGGFKPSSAYLKFDLSGANETHIARARLRLTHGKFNNGPYQLTVSSVTDDSWSEDTLTIDNKPEVGAGLDSLWVENMEKDLVVEFDVTDFVRDEVIGGDGVISLHVGITDGGSGFLSSFWSRERGPHPELIIERVADPVPGAPSAPNNIGSTPLMGNIVLDWDDNPESDVATYKVYRKPYSFGALPIAAGLVTSDHVDTSSSTSWRNGMMEYDQVYHYRLTAVDEHGYESGKSRELVAAPRHPSNSPPTFAGTVDLPNAIAHGAYSASLAGEASDPESDPIYFMKSSGPDWLDVALDGTLSGTPEWTDRGINTFTFQVTAIGGSTQKTVDLVVDLPADDPPGAPRAPVGLTATSDVGSISLNWDENPEGDLDSYKLYRSTSPGSGYTEIAGSLRGSDAIDRTAVDGTPYSYVVRAVDKNGNESAYSDEVSVTAGLDLTPPTAPSGLVATPYSGAVTLGWEANTEEDIADYTLYRSTSPGRYGAALVTGLRSNSFSDSTVVNGTTYYYSVTATDTAGNESAGSVEVSATPDASIVSVDYEFGSGTDSLATAGFTTFVDNDGPGEMLVTDNPGDGNVGIALYNLLDSSGREAQGFYRAFNRLGANDTEDFVITMTFKTPNRNWNSPEIGIQLYGDTASGSYGETGVYASVDGRQNLVIRGGGSSESAKIPQQVLTASATTLELTGIFGDYGTDNLKLILTVSADGVAPTSVTKTVDTTGLSPTQNGFGVFARSDDENRFVVQTFALDLQ